MTSFSRSLPSLAARRSLHVRWLILAALTTLTFTSGLLLAATPAGAVVTTVETTEVGLQPRSVTTPLDGQFGGTFANPSGNPVVHASNIYAIYWDPTLPVAYHPEWESLIDGFLQKLGADSGTLGNVFSVDSQYTDKSNVGASYAARYEVAYTDTHKYPAQGCTDPHALKGGAAITCLTSLQLATELQGFVAQHSLPKGMGSIFYILTPPGVTVCLDAAATSCSDYTRTGGEESEERFESESYRHSFCSYHADINPDKVATGDANTILYAAVPWVAGGAGDGRLEPADQTQAYECQDGGFDPNSKPAEKKERPREKSAKEIEEFNKATAEEKQKALEAEARERPHEQEPNQAGRGEDGTYDTGLADLIIGQIAVEQQNIVTNPLLNAWQDGAKREASDECRNFFASGTLAGSSAANEETGAGTLSNQLIGGSTYYLNNAFNLAGVKFSGFGVPCVASTNLVPKFTAPNPVNSGESIGLNGMESNVMLDVGTHYSAGGAAEPTYATYTWDFGDKTPQVSGFAPGAPVCETPWLSPCAASVLHSYQYGGTYQATLTVTDVGGNSASVTHAITVEGSPPPSPPSPPSPSPSGSSPASSSSGSAAASTQPAGAAATSTGGGTSPAPVPAPVASAAIVSRTLASVMRGGLVVRYSVNEQVAGHFEVLLERALARKLGISGPAAIGLPAGSPPRLVIAKAILVTTAGGRSTVKIVFSKSVATRLARLHKVPLTLRLVVRNASSHTPATTTVLAAVTLTH